MPFWLTWFLIGTLFTGGVAALHNSNPSGTTADVNQTQTQQYYTQNFREGADRAQ